MPRELVGTIEAKHAYAANAAVVRTADHMLGSLIDILA
ncbi:MAG TPA: flagellar basal body rod C-terminal domain-containing protein [Candidatus Krumholzibacteria bacterium]|nr:flagellar basal body rod C-terminal domain-containing protein [Candidatus Krumholzibacteria bacterium]